MNCDVNRFFESRMKRCQAAQDERHRLKLAAAALIEEAAASDPVYEDLELDEVHLDIGRALRLPDDEAGTIIDLATSRDECCRFCDLIRERYDGHEKAEVAELLWQVATVDGHLDRFEWDLVHRAAQMIALPEPELSAALKRVVGV